MSNEKRFVVKHGLQSQNMEFVSPDKAKRISVSMLDSGTISFSGDSGQLFSVTDTMAGTIFAVNDISGIPSIEVDDTGVVRIAETVGNVLIGTKVDNGNKLQVSGSASVSGNLSVNGGISATSGDLNLDTLDLNAITTSKAVTAVDVFVYDTSKDSDGGAWRKRTQHTSWYNETLNTTTRGSRREFPAVAVIVAEATKVTIYDGDDPTLPMWMVLAGGNNAENLPWAGGGSAFSGVTALNGIVALSSNLNNGLAEIRFVADAGYVRNQFSAGFYNGSISQRHASLNYSYVSTGLIISSSANDVAMTVLPNAPIDAATGLPVPTIAVATGGGVSVIKDDGTVVDWMTNVGISSNVVFTEWGGIQTSGGGGVGYATWGINSIPVSDTNTYDYLIGSSWSSTQIPRQGSGGNSTLLPLISTNYGTANAENAGISTNNKLMLIDANQSTYGYSLVSYITPSYNTGWMQGNIKGAFLADINAIALVGSGELVTNGTFNTDMSGWVISANLTATVTGGQVTITNNTGFTAYSENIYQDITGLVVGKTYVLNYNYISGSNRVRLVIGTPFTQVYSNTSTIVTFVATSTSTRLTFYLDGLNLGDNATLDNISVKLADSDRSVNNKGLVINGTITRTPVATGADLVAYSGFSASNYLEQPYNSGLDFGTGDFSVMGWLTSGTTPTSVILSRGVGDQSNTNNTFVLALNGGGRIQCRVYDSAGNLTGDLSGNANLATGVASWRQFVVLRRSGSTEIYVDGLLDQTSAAFNGDVIGGTTRPVFQIGRSAGNIWPTNYFSTGGSGSSLALIRISATAPTADQIAKIYNDEKFLFQENAACTLYGSSDAVTALAHDPDTDLLHVGTSAGRSVFQGLRRVSNTTNPVGTAISACNGLVVEE